MNAAHTQTPWTDRGLGVITGGPFEEYTRGAAQKQIVLVTGDLGETVRDANAAFIVRACNSHDALVVALIELDAAFTEADFDVQRDRMRMRKAIIQARAAIAAAGETP